MSMYRVDLNDNSTTTQNPLSGGGIGDQRGGGMEMNFGGINDSPALKWVFPVLGAVLLLGGVAIWWFSRKKT